MRLPTLLLTCCGLMLGTYLAGEEPARVEIKLSHKGQVFGEGPEWDKQFAREALQIFNDLKPDPAWVEKLKALPDNAWLKCSPAGDHADGPGWRSETPMVYMPDFHACLFASGCGDPGYSSDTWLYKTGANQWVQMWPNFIKGSADKELNKEPGPRDRPERAHHPRPLFHEIIPARRREIHRPEPVPVLHERGEYRDLIPAEDEVDENHPD
jgi:hypothetical protein